MSCSDEKPKCCENKNATKCPPPPPSCPNVPDTATFKCPADCCKKEVNYCPEKKNDECTCIGNCPTGNEQQKQKKC